MPAGDALAVCLSLLLEEGDAMASRYEARERVLELLDVPFDEDEAAEWRRDRWGADSAAERAVTATEQTVGGQAGDFSDIDLDELRAAQ